VAGSRPSISNITGGKSEVLLHVVVFGRVKDYFIGLDECLLWDAEWVCEGRLSGFGGGCRTGYQGSNGAKRFDLWRRNTLWCFYLRKEEFTNNSFLVKTRIIGIERNQPIFT
jgi:hypothetical protein